MTFDTKTAETRTCSKCGESKSPELFYTQNRGNTVTYFPSCRECTKARVTSWRRANPDKAAAYNRKWRENSPGNWKDLRLAKYGITADEYDAMWTKQGGVCAICKKDCKTGQALSVDHCHVTGEVRGLLCRKCNTALGHLGDSVDLLHAAIEYLG